MLNFVLMQTTSLTSLIYFVVIITNNIVTKPKTLYNTTASFDQGYELELDILCIVISVQQQHTIVCMT